MFKRILIFLAAVCCQSLLRAQQPDIQELLDYPQSQQETIARGRNMLFERMTMNDTATVKTLFYYLATTADDEKYMALYPEEYMLYSYWLEQYSNITTLCLKFDSAYITGLYKKRKPTVDMTEAIIDQLREDRQVIYKRIATAVTLDTIDKEFLKLCFDQLMSYSRQKDEAIESLNPRGAIFLEKFRGSAYGEYVKNYIGIEYRTKAMNFSAEFFTGFAAFTGSLGKLLSPVVPLGVVFDFRYRHVVLRLNDYLAYGITRDSIRTDTVLWAKHKRTLAFIPGVNLGYYVVDKPTWKLSPFVGIAATAMGTPLFSSGAGDEDKGFQFTTTFTYGLSAEFFLKRAKATSCWHAPDNHYFRLTYAFHQPQFEKRYGRYDGSMHSLTVGYVMVSNPTRRVR